MIFLAVVSLDAQRAWVQQGPAPTTGGQVENVGDGEVSGAVNALAAHPTNADVLYAGTVNGGVWRTSNATNGRPTWVEQLGANRSLSIGAIAFDPTDPARLTLVAGSGRFSSFGRGGDRSGVWRTTDGGTTPWTLLDGGGRLRGLNVSGVAPRASIIVLSANAGDANSTPGIWRTANGGATWDLMSGANGSGLRTGPASDLASDPSDPTCLYTNAGRSGIFRTADTGATWTKVSNAAMDELLQRAGNVRITVGGSGEVYVAIASARLIGLFRSPNGAAPWAELDLPVTTERGALVGIHVGGQADIHLSLVADRTNRNVVYVGGDRQPNRMEATSNCQCGVACVCFPNSIGANDYSGRLFRVDASRPRGSQASPITHVNTSSNSAPHADSRDMVTDANGALLEANDGGVYRRTAPLTNTGDWVSVNGDLNIAEIHSVAWDANANVVLAGAQDTGTPEQVTTSGTRWRSADTADGGDVCVDSGGSSGVSIRYSSYQTLGNFQRRTFDSSNVQLSQEFPRFIPVNGSREVEPAFITPLAVNQVDPTRLVIGAENAVYESFDQGDTVEEISPVVIINAFDGDPIAYGGGGNADMLYVGAADEVLVRTTVGDPLVPSLAYPGSGSRRSVADIAIDRGDANVAFVADERDVYRTSDAGATWADITGNLRTLEAGRLLAIAYSTSNTDGSVLVGGTTGVFVSRGPSFGTWSRLGSGLPLTAVYDLAYDPSDQILVAGLLGRGTWAIDMKEDSQP